MAYAPRGLAVEIRFMWAFSCLLKQCIPAFVCVCICRAGEMSRG